MNLNVNGQRNRIGKKVGLLLLVLFVYMMVPFAITMSVTGIIEEDVSDQLINGRRVVVQYKNASKSMDINKFIIFVLADRFSMSDQIEVLKAESVMIRTDIYRMMGDNMSIDSTSLGFSFKTEQQMKNEWGDLYETNYNLIADCVAYTGDQVIVYNSKLIEARYTPISNGTTLAGADFLGEEYAYLAKVACPNDIECPDYLAVYTYSYKDFVKKLKAQYQDVGLDESNPYKDIQVVSKTEDGYIVKLQVGNVIMTGTKFKDIMGINSSCMVIDNLGDCIKITTKGKGDGFGMSIFTADFMARQGTSYNDILQTFYTGITIISE
jgi:stage II sporulation protein D